MSGSHRAHGLQPGRNRVRTQAARGWPAHAMGKGSWPLGAALCLALLGACPEPQPPRPPRRIPPSAARPQRFVPPEAYRELMLAELSWRSPTVAIAHLRSALASDPLSPYLRLRLADLLARRGRQEEAQRLAREALRLDRASPKGYLVLGRLLSAGYPGRALRVLERGLVRNPADEELHLWVARLRLRMGDPQGERAALRRLLVLRPDSAEALFALARSWAREGGLDRARRLLERLLKSRPFALGPRLLLARVLLRKGRRAKAAEALLAAMEASGDDPEVARELFRLYLLRRDRRRALDLVRLMSAHGSATHLTFAASLLVDLGKTRQAFKVLDRVLLMGGAARGVAVALKARLVYRGRGPAPALALLERVRKGPALAPARVAAARILEREGWSGRAVSLLRKTLGKLPRNVALLEALALVHARRGEAREAARLATAAQAARGSGPTDPVSRRFMALLLDEAGRLGKAAKIAEQLAREDPDDAAALNLLGYALADRGLDIPRAVGLLSRALSLEPLSPYILDSLGWARYRQGRLEEAVRLLSLATRLEAGEAELWEHLGDALAGLRRVKRAVAAYERALGLRPAVSRRAAISGKIALLLGHGYLQITTGE